LFPIRDRQERIQTVLMPVIQWGSQKRIKRRMSGRPLRIVMEAPGITQEETTGFDFNFDEFTSLAPAFGREKRCPILWKIMRNEY